VEYLPYEVSDTSYINVFTRYRLHDVIMNSLYLHENRFVMNSLFLYNDTETLFLTCTIYVSISI